jgi:hypothetical protein
MASFEIGSSPLEEGPPVTSLGGMVPSYRYFVWIAFPSGAHIDVFPTDVHVVEPWGVDPEFEVYIGMDVISLGKLTVQANTFSFVF